jgi:glucosyl-dolichyl phosphate glucuronosyltransferase
MIDSFLNVSIVICAYTEERWLDLLAAVESIQRQTLPPSEVIVVIDHNALLFERAKMHMKDVLVIENDEPKGLSGSRNCGITLAQGTFIAFLDDDAIAEPDWLERLTTSCNKPDVLGVGGAVEPLWVGKHPEWFPKEFYWVVGCSYQGLPNVLTAVRNPYGGCTCIKREVFEQVGGFRNGIGRIGTKPLGGEETELSIRAMQHWPNKVFLCEPRAKIYHRVPAHRVSWRYFRERCYAEGLSKAIIAMYVGTKYSLSTEKSYVYKVLPRGIVSGVRDAILKRDVNSFLRAGAIFVGLAATTTGYVVGRIMHRWTYHDPYTVSIHSLNVLK